MAATTLEVLNEAETPPFPVDDRIDADEMLRLRHRYVDLRRPRLQRNLRVRAQINAALHRSLDAQGFTEVETPMLIASTPEGARDFVVPSRLSPGEFYALPQSPQLFKQLLMVGGMDRYYQIARCLRDEDLRADRQFEFMQLDAEMSFADADDVWPSSVRPCSTRPRPSPGTRPAPVSRMTWHQAQERYGSDKPDVRFGLELVDLERGVRRHRVPGLPGRPGEGRSGCPVRAHVARPGRQAGRPGQAARRRRPRVDAGVIDGGGARLPGAQVPVRGRAARHRRRAWAPSAGDLLLIAAGARRLVDHVLGTLRVELGRPPVHEGGLQFLWVVDFPLFESLDDDGRPIPAHHPFTMPHPDDLELLAHGTGEDLLAVRSQAYDLVLNGWELGSGSVRIHRPTSSSGSSRCSASRPRRRSRASASCSTRSATARRRTPASPSASTASPRSWRGRRTSAR